MTDIIKRLRKCESMLMQDLCLQAADEIERLTQCLFQMQEAAKDLTRELAGEREYHEGYKEGMLEDVALLMQKLAESQARERVLVPVGLVDKSGPGPLEVRLDASVEYGCALPHGTKLYLSTDRTALDALLAAERAKVEPVTSVRLARKNLLHRSSAMSHDCPKCGAQMLWKYLETPFCQTCNGEKADELDDEHPLWLVNEQIKGLLDGEGASEDHENVLDFLRMTGLPEDTVKRMHRAIVCGDAKAKETLDHE